MNWLRRLFWDCLHCSVCGANGYGAGYCAGCCKIICYDQATSEPRPFYGSGEYWFCPSCVASKAEPTFAHPRDGAFVR